MFTNIATELEKGGEGAKLEKLFVEKFLCNMIGFRCLREGDVPLPPSINRSRLRGVEFSYWFSICGVIVCCFNKENNN